MSRQNRPLKAALVLLFGNQSDACMAMGLQESRLSLIIHGKVPPSPRERRALGKVFGAERVELLLKGTSADASEAI